MRCARPLRSDASLVAAVSVVSLVALLSLYLRSPSCSAPERPSEPRAWPTRHPPRADPAPCHANLSWAAHPDFKTLPPHVRDFLLYKHCRRFRLLQDPAPLKCADPVFLLLVIKSSPHNYERREMVRHTWGRERQVRGRAVRRIFLVGSDRDPHQARKVDRLLQLEAATHRDILQWDFHDSFFNLTLKQVLFLEWQETWCPQASFLLDGDDDVFAHTDNIVTFLEDHDPDRHLFVGHLIQNVGPIRVSWSKYYVPKLVTAQERYPPYCGGGGFLLSRFTAAALRQAAPTLDVFPIDDVFVGMCLQRQGLAPAAHSGVRMVGVHSPSSRLSSFDPCFYRDLLLVHRFLPYEMLLMWDALSQDPLRCGQRGHVY